VLTHLGIFVKTGMKVEETFRFFLVGCIRNGLDAGILAKGAMRRFWKIVSRGSSRVLVPGKRSSIW